MILQHLLSLFLLIFVPGSLLGIGIYALALANSNRKNPQRVIPIRTNLDMICKRYIESDALDPTAMVNFLMEVDECEYPFDAAPQVIWSSSGGYDDPSVVCPSCGKYHNEPSVICEKCRSNEIVRQNKKYLDYQSERKKQEDKYNEWAKEDLFPLPTDFRPQWVVVYQSGAAVSQMVYHDKEQAELAARKLGRHARSQLYIQDGYGKQLAVPQELDRLETTQNSVHP